MKYTFQVDNIRCGGCANTITKKLTEIHGVEEVQVDVENKQVIVTTNELNSNETHRLISDKLIQLGYPESGQDNANNLKVKAKSVVSCAIGKISNKNQLY